MNMLKTLVLGFGFVTGIVPSANLFAEETISAEQFIEEASAKGLAELETAKIALKKSTSEEVKSFAQTMTTDHTKTNEELKKIADSKNIDLSDDPELIGQTKTFLLKQRDGNPFDLAYANNQVLAHEKTIDLFQKGTRLKDPELKDFAQKTLPQLQHHLQMAKDLQAALGKQKPVKTTQPNTDTGDTNSNQSAAPPPSRQ